MYTSSWMWSTRTWMCWKMWAFHIVFFYSLRYVIFLLRELIRFHLWFWSENYCIESCPCSKSLLILKSFNQPQQSALWTYHWQQHQPLIAFSVLCRNLFQKYYFDHLWTLKMRWESFVCCNWTVTVIPGIVWTCHMLCVCFRRIVNSSYMYL